MIASERVAKAATVTARRCALEIRIAIASSQLLVSANAVNLN